MPCPVSLSSMTVTSHWRVSPTTGTVASPLLRQAGDDHDVPRIVLLAAGRIGDGENIAGADIRDDRNPSEAVLGRDRRMIVLCQRTVGVEPVGELRGFQSVSPFEHRVHEAAAIGAALRPALPVAGKMHDAIMMLIIRVGRLDRGEKIHRGQQVRRRLASRAGAVPIAARGATTANTA